MNTFFVIPTVVDGKGRIFVQQSEHNGRTRSLYEEDVDLEKLEYIRDQFSKAIQELKYQSKAVA